MAVRPLRVLFVANDGLSVGHVMRSLAIARALARRARARRIEVQSLLATTSEAHALLGTDATLASVRLPAPALARRAGFSDLERRRIVRGTMEGLAGAFGPDVVVVDTFPSGPHGELLGIGGRRVLVRRNVPETREGDPPLMDGIETCELAILADDPTRVANERASLPVPSVVCVPPITWSETDEASSRDAARKELGLPLDRRVILVASGGGGDASAVERAHAIADSIARLAPDVFVATAFGPLAPSQAPPGGRVLARPILAPLLAAFDGAFAPAGYNTAHELAKAGVPAALFAQPRPFDDQAARAARFAAASLAHALERFDGGAIALALGWMETATIGPIERGGADRAADALLDRFVGPGAAA